MSMEPKMNFMASLEKSLADAVTAAELPGVMRRIRDALDGYEMTQREEYLGEDDLLKIYTSAMVVQGRSQKTIDRYVYIIKRLTTETGVPAGRITIHHIRAWLAKEQDRGIRDTTLEGYRQVFSAYFGWLQRESLIDRNPTANLGAIKCAKVRKEAFVEVDMEKLKRVAERAGVENVHPHRFRRTLATSLSRHGMPIQEVAAILGHEKIDTTMRYVEMDDDNIRSAYRRYA